MWPGCVVMRFTLILKAFYYKKKWQNHKFHFFFFFTAFECNRDFINSFVLILSNQLIDVSLTFLCFVRLLAVFWPCLYLHFCFWLIDHRSNRLSTIFPNIWKMSDWEKLYHHVMFITDKSLTFISNIIMLFC